ncbi:hypothetical protein BDB01DRAFT_281518 [Pilobolus umbonatus]|nr:hypothetical protein BDB01DRAFT_281518 [Pilobolus umbonatus]
MLTFILYFCIKLGLLQLYPAYITYLSIEYFTDIFLFWIPFYTEFKLILLLWLILPQTQGTTLVYNRYLFPYLEQNEEYIDTTLISIQHKLKDILVLYGKQCIDGMKKIVLDMFFKVIKKMKND